MKIILLTPIYATTTKGAGATPVVHYFAREWVKMGHEVIVYHFVARFPRFYYWVGRAFQHQLNTKLGMLIPVDYPSDGDYVAEGVVVHRRCLNKIIPHSRYTPRILNNALNYIVEECDRSGVPDRFVGHWDNPQLDLLYLLKHHYGIPTCIVFHQNGFSFEKHYGKDIQKILDSMDVIGFRSKISEQKYEAKYGIPKHSFIASSGVSKAFLTAGDASNKVINKPIRNFVFVGSLIARKFPVEIITALSHVYPDGDYTMTFIGDGAERIRIEEEYHRLGELGTLRFTGRIPREEIIDYLKDADVFVMISRAEIFGLVYLEAMALGLIPIGSKNEGIDGVIRHGENGFLCEAGSVADLERVLNEMKRLSSKQLSQLSEKARETALKYSDENVAKNYIDQLINI